MGLIKPVIDFIVGLLVIGLVGTAIDFTIAMKNKAIDAHLRGPMSYGAFSRMLTSKSVKKQIAR